MSRFEQLPMFGGLTFDPDRDGDRLSRQLRAVQAVMADGAWRTLAAIAADTGEPEASISARLRDLRKPQFGGHTVERRHIEAGLWEYRLIHRRLAEVAI